MSTDRWIDKDAVVYISNGILFSHKKVWNNAFCSNMDGLEIIMLSDLSQRHTLWYHLCVESKIWHKWTYPQTETDSQRADLWLPRGWGWADWEFGVSRCKLLYIGLISSILLYRVRNYTQYPVINQNGQEYENIYIYISIILRYSRN